MKKSTKIIIAIVAIVAVIAVLIGIYALNAPQTTEGSKKITVEVTNKAGETTSYNLGTDQEYLKGALDELAESADFSLEGTESEYGLYITAINGETADYDADGAYWSIYVNGEYGMYGVDSQPVNDGEVYTFAYEVYQAQ